MQRNPTRQLDLSQRFHQLKHPLYHTVVLLLLLLACRPGSLLEPDSPPSPTATPVAIRFQLQKDALQGVESVSHKVALEPTFVPVTVTPTPTRPSATIAPVPTRTPTSRATVTPEASISFQSPTPTTSPAYTGDVVPITDDLALLAPAADSVLPPELDQLEFKWAWTGPELRPCQVAEGFGFELRIWPDPNPASNPHLSESDRQSIKPLGVLDASQNQDEIAQSCDPDYLTRRYTVNYLKRTPGVHLAGGHGHFLWDVAYVQLEPYELLKSSAPRAFSIPPDSNAHPTPVPQPVATPICPMPVNPKPQGNITLVEPQEGHTFPANVGPVEFRWQWAGQNQADKCAMAEGFGFELRIWSQRPDFGPVGVMDVVANQDQIHCDPMSGVHTYTVPDLKQAEGVKATYLGEYRWDGQFLWDVALVSLNPYRPPDSASPPRSFVIDVNRYTGSLDPFGAPLNCRHFNGWPEAQAIFLASGGPSRDPHDLDSDGNQVACDQLRQ